VTHQILGTLASAALAGALLVAVAQRLRVPAIALLLVGGVALGPEGLGWIDPAALGPGLSIVVSAAVAVILFEGGLSLDVAGYRGAPRMIRRMLTIGVLVTWSSAGLAAWYFLDLPPRLAVTAGALVIVTGPTVIAPLLRRVAVRPRLHHVLYWEGVLIDAVGVFVAVLCLEWVIEQDAAFSLGKFAVRIAVGGGLGLVVGRLLAFGLSRGLVRDDQTNAVALAVCLGLFAGADALAREAGVLAVVVAGLVVALRHPPQLGRLKRFKLELTDLGIGVLFVLLSAKLRVAQFTSLGAGLGGFVAVVLLSRPIGIWIASIGTELSVRERIFLSWIAPRGIVAASMASLFALDLERAGFAEAHVLETTTFAVIAVTVIGQGLSSPGLARLLRLRHDDRPAWLLLGDEVVVAALARAMREAGVPVMIASGGAHAEALRARDVELVDRDQAADLERVGHVLDLHAADGWHAAVPQAERHAWPDAVWARLPDPDAFQRGLSAGTLEITVIDAPVPGARLPAGAVPLFQVEAGRAVSIAERGGGEEGGRWIILRERVPDLAGRFARAVVAEPELVGLESVLRRLVGLAIDEHPDLDPASVTRDAEAATFEVGPGVALTAAYSRHARRSRCYVACLRPTAEQEGRLHVLLVSPQNAPDEHLAGLSAVSKLVSVPDRVARLTAQTTAADVERALREWS
jgi:NhaP-type Na+/H+ or K+/H+ antiporter/mannitol/fructose-specific phosphotransferase system IIA component (Ntr-type)